MKEPALMIAQFIRGLMDLKRGVVAEIEVIPDSGHFSREALLERHSECFDIRGSGRSLSLSEEVMTDQNSGPVVFDTPEGIAFYTLVARRGALRLELAGLRRSSGRRTAYSVCKQAYGLRGSRHDVLAALNQMIDEAIDQRAAARHAKGDNS
jgi:hypothetical protein